MKYQLTEKRKKIAIIALILALIFTMLLGAFWIRRNNDDRSKALTANQVSVTFDKASYQLTSVGSELRVDVILEVLPTSNISAAAITVNYPTSVLTLNTTKTKSQAANAGDSCNFLDQTLSYSADETTGVVKLVKASYNDVVDLPKGKFCYGALFFTVKSTTASAALKFGGNATTLADWDIVGKSGRYQVLLGADAPVSAGTTTGTPKPNVNINFEKASIALGAVGSDLKMNVLFDAGTNMVVGGGITFNYPTNILEFNETKTKDQGANADATCTGLDQVLYVTADATAGSAKVVKITYKPEAELPKGNFCFATLFFKVKSLSTTASSAVAFSGDITSVKDWDIVTKAGRAAPVLGTSIKLTSGTTTITPVATGTPTSTVTTTPTATPSTTVTTTPTKTPTTTMTPVATASPTVTPSLGCSPPSIYSCQKIKTGTTCQFENKPDGSICKQDGTYGSCQQGSCNTAITPFITITPDCPRKPEGDADCNGIVNLDDFEIFRSEFVKIRRGEQDLNNIESDFNDDGFIDIEDFAIFRLTFVNENFTDSSQTATE